MGKIKFLSAALLSASCMFLFAQTLPVVQPFLRSIGSASAYGKLGETLAQKLHAQATIVRLSALGVPSGQSDTAALAALFAASRNSGSLGLVSAAIAAKAKAGTASLPELLFLLSAGEYVPVDASIDVKASIARIAASMELENAAARFLVSLLNDGYGIQFTYPYKKLGTYGNKTVMPIAESAKKPEAVLPVSEPISAPQSAYQFSRMIAQYAFDGTAVNSIDANYAGVPNAISYVPGKKGQALNLNGVSSYVKIPPIATSSKMTISVWFNCAYIDGYGPLYNGNDWNRPGLVHIQFWEGRINYCIRNATDDLYVNYAFRNNTWYHFVLTYNAEERKGAIYVNGVKVEDYVIESGVSAIIGDGRIGAWNQEKRYFNGMIDEFAAYDSVLSDEEIQKIYSGYQ